MRRDNPHISKRRGGRAKTGHRKFSLQAFHAKHLGGNHAHSTSSSNSQNQQQQNQKAGQHQQQAESHKLGTEPNGTPASHDGKAFAVAHKKLPVVVEHEFRHLDGDGEGELDEAELGSVSVVPTHKSSAAGVRNRAGSGLGQSKSNNSATTEQRRVRVDDRQAESNVSATTNNLPHHHHHHHHHHQQHQHNKTSRRNTTSSVLGQAEPTSISSAGVYFDDDTLILNDSQSSGNVSPQRQLSFVCSQSSIHREDSSLN